MSDALKSNMSLTKLNLRSEYTANKQEHQWQRPTKHFYCDQTSRELDEKCRRKIIERCIDDKHNSNRTLSVYVSLKEIKQEQPKTIIFCGGFTFCLLN